MDVVYPGHRHIPFATLGPQVAERTITLTSASKSFNLGGMRCAVAIFGSPALRARFDTLPPRVRSVPNVLGIRATIAAWRSGGAWLGFDTAGRGGPTWPGSTSPRWPWGRQPRPFCSTARAWP